MWNSVFFNLNTKKFQNATLVQDNIKKTFSKNESLSMDSCRTNEFFYAVSDNIEVSHISYNESQHLHKPKVEVFS